MKKQSYRVIAAIAVSMSLLLSAACGSQKATSENTAEQTTKETTASDTAKKEPIKISWMTSQAKFKDVFKDMAAQLEKDEGISIDFQVIPDDQYYNLVKAKLATAELTDIIEHNTPTENSTINASKNMVDLSGEPWVARLVNPNLLKDSSDGKTYAMPRESSSFFGPAYYNKKVFKDLGISEEQPKTYKEFLDILEKIKASGKGITPLYTSEKDSWTTQIFMTLGFSVALNPNDKDVYGKIIENKMKWSDVPEFKKVLSDYNEIYKRGLTNKDHMSATYDMAKEAVATGKAAMMLNGEWAASDIMAKWPETELGAWVVPFNDKLIMATGAYVQGLYVPNQGSQVENVKKFLNLWSQPKYQNMYWAANPGFPAFKDVDGGKTIPCVQALVDNYISTGKYTTEMNGVVSVASPILSELWKYYVEMTIGAKTPEEVLGAWDKKFSDYMKQKQQPGF